MNYEEAIALYYSDVKKSLQHVPEIGERWEQTLYLDSVLIPDLDKISIDWLFEGSEIPPGCVFEKEEIGVDFVKRTYIYKGEKKNEDKI